MKVQTTQIEGLLVIEPKVFGDERGFFCETWQAERYREAGVEGEFVQDNHSRSRQGVLRGLHYQIKQPQGKLVRVTHGEVFDVAVDMRRSSPTFGQWYGVVLSGQNHRQFWVPPGFAHGFYVMSESADFHYKCTDYYAPEHERSLLWSDKQVGIEWPLVDTGEPELSAKDAQGVPFVDAEAFD
ncbi:dTDP-4-dehydrorhamnose 3,5-epimerase [Litorivivens lipolytica]|uniref:dTDP-4-dehydrorhamnose 3,5-epimerase n=1 Tax=Litorivivens lipolytica TaxID=1524264 RepID=A0A7W4Z6W7_9GAMM|nr:dTDP-4-dehydrorhamnose 3,5-epimerase [Litorivivens lipolytica]MBB3047311.1 dTDP-4-dehydrorhamnose 3,5-epimerase [Litorivivens lipolytica]